MSSNLEICLKEELDLFKKETFEVLKSMKSTIAEMKKFANEMKQVIAKNLAENLKLSKASHKAVMEHQHVLNNMKDTSENCEQTLLNVLLAIRQNEYLQAWYPAQSGFPEMKVVG